MERWEKSADSIYVLGKRILSSGKFQSLLVLQGFSLSAQQRILRMGGLMMWVDGDESNRIFTSPVGGQLPSFSYFLTNTWAPLLLFSKSNCVTYRIISPTTRNSEVIESSSLTELCRCQVLFFLWILVFFHHFCSVSRHPIDRDWNLRFAPDCLMLNKYSHIVKLLITL